jgi:nucleotide-binding universal stress UspA family protein
MYRNVIVAVDGRHGGRDAAALAAILAAPGGLLSLVYVSTSSPDAELDDEFADEDALAGPLEAELELCGGEAHLARVTALSIAAGLAHVAQERRADLIVLGASHRHALTRLIAGDHVTSVIHRTSCAVAVAPAGFAQDPRPLDRIGVAYDGTPEGEVAVAHAGLLATERDCDLIACHALDPRLGHPGPGLPPLVADRPGLEPAGQPLGGADGLEVQRMYGPPRQALLEFSRSVDLLVCGSRRNGPVRRIILGSTSESLARHPRTPLIVAPSSDDPSTVSWRGAQRERVDAQRRTCGGKLV